VASEIARGDVMTLYQFTSPDKRRPVVVPRNSDSAFTNNTNFPALVYCYSETTRPLRKPINSLSYSATRVLAV
jgi:hypothetical protein